VIGEVHGTLNKVILTIAIAFGTINVVGGFLVTDRMLEMFKGRKPATQEEIEEAKDEEEKAA
jgi:NAD(P) transhydrogenase subunit alpha